MGIQNNLRFPVVISLIAFWKFYGRNLALDKRPGDEVDFLGVTFLCRGFFRFYLKPWGFFIYLFIFSVEQRRDVCVSRTLRPINAKKIAPVLHIIFRGQLVA